MAIRNIVGSRIKLARKKIKPAISQTDLAARLQVEGFDFDRLTITKIEIGYREVTDIEVKAFSKVLGVPISWLYSEDDIQKQKRRP